MSPCRHYQIPELVPCFLRKQCLRQGVCSVRNNPQEGLSTGWRGFSGGRAVAPLFPMEVSGAASTSLSCFFSGRTLWLHPVLQLWSQHPGLPVLFCASHPIPNHLMLGNCWEYSCPKHLLGIQQSPSHADTSWEQSIPAQLCTQTVHKQF